MHYVEGSYKTYQALADIPAGTAVKLNASNQVIAAAAAADKIIGVVQYNAKAGQNTDVRLRSAAGTICMKAGSGAITLGAAVTSDASGLGLVTTTGGDQIIGYALEAVAAGKMFELLPSTAKY
jgi:hypothetical protein